MTNVWNPLWLRDVHIGYYRIVLSVLASHIALAVDSFLPSRHDAPVFTYVQPLLGWYGWMHIIVAVAILAGLLLAEQWWPLARAAFFISLLTFNTYAAGMLFGAYFHGGSLIGPIGLIALSVSSAAAWREPTLGPPFRSLHHRAT